MIVSPLALEIILSIPLGPRLLRMASATPLAATMLDSLTSPALACAMKLPSPKDALGASAGGAGAAAALILPRSSVCAQVGATSLRGGGGCWAAKAQTAVGPLEKI